MINQNTFKTTPPPTDSEIIEMLRLKVLENPSFTTLIIPKGLLLNVPKKIQGMQVIESALAGAGQIYFANTESWR